MHSTTNMNIRVIYINSENTVEYKKPFGDRTV